MEEKEKEEEEEEEEEEEAKHINICYGMIIIIIFSWHAT